MGPGQKIQMPAAPVQPVDGGMEFDGGLSSMDDRWMDGWLDGWMDGWLAGWVEMDGWVDAGMDG